MSSSSRHHKTLDRDNRKGSHDQKKQSRKGKEPQVDTSYSTDPHIDSFSCESQGCSIFNAERIQEKWPELKYIPRPRPTTRNSHLAHNKWLKEYEHWNSLKCDGPGSGYFCRTHGMWITCAQVEARQASTQSQEGNGTCPENHYARDDAVAQAATPDHHPLPPPAPAPSDVSYNNRPLDTSAVETQFESLGFEDEMHHLDDMTRSNRASTRNPRKQIQSVAAAIPEYVEDHTSRTAPSSWDYTRDAQNQQQTVRPTISKSGPYEDESNWNSPRNSRKYQQSAYQEPAEPETPESGQYEHYPSHTFHQQSREYQTHPKSRSAVPNTGAYDTQPSYPQGGEDYAADNPRSQDVKYQEPGGDYGQDPDPGYPTHSSSGSREKHRWSHKPRH